MTTPVSHTSFDDFLNQALDDAPTRAAYEDAQARNRLVDTLVRLRRRLGFTQSQVATSMGVKQPTVSGFETEGSDPRLSTIQRYARSVDAVFVWDLQPRGQALRPDAYVSHQQNLHTSVNQAKPSNRARAWKPRSDVTGTMRYPDAA
jgi:transcriptional regulator with XRE-family HTH domain